MVRCPTLSSSQIQSTEYVCLDHDYDLALFEDAIPIHDTEADGRQVISSFSARGYARNTRHSRGPISFWTLDGKDIYKELLSTAYFYRNMFPPADSTIVSRCARTKASIPFFFSQTNVSLRNAGKTRTIFEGPASTCGQGSRRRSGGTHHCNGTNNDNNPCPGPTCVTALDYADEVAKFGFDG